MTDRYSVCLAFVLRQEGGYSNNKYDKGGPTNKGIIQAEYDDYLHNCNLPHQSVQFITDAQVNEIYKKKYWDRVHGDDISQPVDLVTFDGAVNHGPGQAVRFLQRAINMQSVDGIFGPNTLDALKNAINIKGSQAIADSIITQREIFYRNIVANNPTQGVFLNGWLNRMHDLEKAVA
jgi:lysozyme family protein